jgi:hypothetical protein
VNSRPQPFGWYCGDVTVQRSAPPTLSLCGPNFTSLDILMGFTIAVHRPAVQL